VAAALASLVGLCPGIAESTTLMQPCNIARFSESPQSFRATSNSTRASRLQSLSSPGSEEYRPVSLGPSGFRTASVIMFPSWRRPAHEVLGIIQLLQAGLRHKTESGQVSMQSMFRFSICASVSFDVLRGVEIAAPSAWRLAEFRDRTRKNHKGFNVISMRAIVHIKR
jgi:hypothetical protein